MSNILKSLSRYSVRSQVALRCNYRPQLTRFQYRSQPVLLHAQVHHPQRIVTSSFCKVASKEETKELTKEDANEEAKEEGKEEASEKEGSNKEAKEEPTEKEDLKEEGSKDSKEEGSKEEGVEKKFTEWMKELTKGWKNSGRKWKNAISFFRILAISSIATWCGSVLWTAIMHGVNFVASIRTLASPRKDKEQKAKKDEERREMKAEIIGVKREVVGLKNSVSGLDRSVAGLKLVIVEQSDQIKEELKDLKPKGWFSGWFSG